MSEKITNPISTFTDEVEDKLGCETPQECDDIVESQDVKDEIIGSYNRGESSDKVAKRLNYQYFEEGGMLEIDTIYDNGGKTRDRYTLIDEDGDMYAIGGRDINMHLGNTSEYPSDLSYLGKKVKYEDLSAEIKKEIDKRLDTSNFEKVEELEEGEIYEYEYQDKVYWKVSDLSKNEYNNFCEKYRIDSEDANSMSEFISNLTAQEAKKVMKTLDDKKYAKGGSIEKYKIKITSKNRELLKTKVDANSLDEAEKKAKEELRWVIKDENAEDKYYPNKMILITTPEGDELEYEEDDFYAKGGEISSETFEEVSEMYGVPMKALKDYAKSKNLTNKTLEDKVSSHYMGTYDSDAEMAEENNLEHHLDDNLTVKPEMYSIYGDNSYFTEFNYKEGGDISDKKGKWGAFWKKSKELGQKGYKKSQELAKEANERRKMHNHDKREGIAKNVIKETVHIVKQKEKKGGLSKTEANKDIENLKKGFAVIQDNYNYPEGPKAAKELAEKRHWKMKKVRTHNPSPYFEKGGSVQDKEYVLERYYVYVHKDDYEEGELEMVQEWNSSDYQEYNKTFSSKSALMDFIKEVIERDTYEDNTRDDYFMIDSDEDETTINYSVLCKYNDLDRGYDHYEKANDEEIEQWKKGELELFSVSFTFRVKVYEPRKKAEFSKGGEVILYIVNKDGEYANHFDNEEDAVMYADEKWGETDDEEWTIEKYNKTKGEETIIWNSGEYEDGRGWNKRGGEVKKKEGNEMIIGGLAGILFGFFLNR